MCKLSCTVSEQSQIKNGLQPSNSGVFGGEVIMISFHVFLIIFLYCNFYRPSLELAFRQSFKNGSERNYFLPKFKGNFV